MRKKLKAATLESLMAVGPITTIVFLLSVFISPMPVGTMGLFLLGSILLIIGMGFFTLGAEMALIEMGEDIGISLTKTKKLVLIALISFAMGAIITLAEPDLQVLAELVPGIPNFVLVLTVACGVGVFLVVAIVRILFRISLSKLLIGCYAFLIVLSVFVPKEFVAVAFDSGGVTTGPITVPFILAMGLGLASVRGDKESFEDSFGLVALCSVGPILAVMVLGITYNPESVSYVPPEIPEVITSQDVALEFWFHLPDHLGEVIASVWPIIAVLLIFQLITRRYNAERLIRMLIGFAYTFIGLTLFLTGVSVGFIPVGQSLGATIANAPIRWLLVPLGGLIGYFIVAAEPAVQVLKKQIEDVSGGAIPGAAVQRYLSIGVAVSLAVSMLRVLTGISVYWFLVPGYCAALILTFFVPKIFTGIAFDSGGVVSGPMTSTFLLPFAIGACVDPTKIMTEAFGLVAMVAMTPLIAIQLMGITYKKTMENLHDIDVPGDEDNEILELEDIVEFDGE